MSKIETFIESVITIVKEGKLVGVIYNDPEVKKAIVYSCSETEASEIAQMISGEAMQNGRSGHITSGKKVETVSDDDE